MPETFRGGDRVVTRETAPQSYHKNRAATFFRSETVFGQPFAMIFFDNLAGRAFGVITIHESHIRHMTIEERRFTGELI